MLKLGERLGLRRHERVAALILFTWCFCGVGAFFVGRAVRDALFLAHLGAARLPELYVASPIAVTVFGLAYARVADRYRRDVLVVVVSLTLAGLAVATRLGLAAGAGDWLYYALYIGVQVMGALVIVQLWTSASACFTSRQARRAFALVGAGGTAADIAIGVVVTASAQATGAENLLWLCAGLLVVVAMLAVALARVTGDALAVAPQRTRSQATATATKSPPAGAGHLKLVAGVIGCTVAAVTLADFAFKAIAADHYGTDREGMIGFFGVLSIATGVVSLVVSVALTRRVLDRVGVTGALLVLPLFVGTGLSAVLIAPVLVIAAYLKATEETFRFTINDAGMQLLYIPVPSWARGRFKALLDVAVKPGAALLVGLALTAYRAAATVLAPVAVAGLAVVAIWVALVVRLRREYMGSILQTLRQGRLDLGHDGDAFNAEELRVVRGALAGDDPELARAAIAVAAPAADRLVPELRSRLADDDVRVRAAACKALASLARAEHVETFRGLARDDDLELAAAALGGLLRAAPGDRGGRQNLDRWLTSPDPNVRDSGLVAASLAGDPALLPSLLEPLAAGSPLAVRAAAACALGAEPTLAALAADGTAPVSGRRQAVRALGRIASESAVGALVDLLTDEGSVAELRAAAASALASASDRTPLSGAQRERVRSAIDRELHAAYTALAAAEGLGRPETTGLPDGTHRPAPLERIAPAGAAGLISKALRRRTDKARDRALALCAALYPGERMRAVRANLLEPSAARRAGAIDVLEDLLDNRLRARVIPLVDDKPRYARVKAASVIYDLPVLDRDEWVERLLDDDSPAMVACAAYFAGMHGVLGVVDRIEALTSAADSAVREAAFVALERLVDRARILPVAGRLADDDFEPLARRAREVAAC